MHEPAPNHPQVGRVGRGSTGPSGKDQFADRTTSLSSNAEIHINVQIERRSQNLRRFLIVGRRLLPGSAFLVQFRFDPVIDHTFQNADRQNAVAQYSIVKLLNVKPISKFFHGALAHL